MIEGRTIGADHYRSDCMLGCCARKSAGCINFPMTIRLSLRWMFFSITSVFAHISNVFQLRDVHIQFKFIMLIPQSQH